MVRWKRGDSGISRNVTQMDQALRERKRRRRELLETLREAAELRARLTPRASALARSRALVHARTTRG